MLMVFRLNQSLDIYGLIGVAYAITMMGLQILLDRARISLFLGEVDGFLDCSSLPLCYALCLVLNFVLSLVYRCYFAQHDKTMLIGADPSHVDDRCIRVTIHHCFFDGTRQRQPRLRFGKVHLYNNYTRNWGIYAVCASVEAQVNSFIETQLHIFDHRLGHKLTSSNLNYVTEIRYSLNATYMKRERRRKLLNTTQRRSILSFHLLLLLLLALEKILFFL